MKLTKRLRYAFVRAVMDDVPQEDYREKAQEAVVKAAVQHLPPEVAAVWNNSKTRDYIGTVAYGFYDDCFWTLRGPYLADTSKVEDCEAVRSLVKRLYQADREQYAKREALEAKLIAAAAGCTTTKQLREMLPEFAKYLPEETVSAKNLPAVTDLVTDFVKAGWPKGEKK